MYVIGKLQELNRKSYEAIASEFDATRQKPWTEMVELTQSLKPGSRVLDLGCGNGRLLKALPKVNFEYVGIDGNQCLLDQAKKQFPGKEFANATLEAADLGYTMYDVIYCIATFHHVPGIGMRRKVLKKMHQALKPDGELVMTVWNLWQGKYWLYYWSHFFLKIDWNDLFIPWKTKQGRIWRYYHCFSRTELYKLLSQAGFRNIDIRSNRKEKGIGYNYVVKARK